MPSYKMNACYKRVEFHETVDAPNINLAKEIFSLTYDFPVYVEITATELVDNHDETTEAPKTLKEDQYAKL